MVPLRVVPVTTVAPASVPPDRVKLPATCTVVVTVRLPPDKVRFSFETRLLTVSVPDEWVIVTSAEGTSMTTSSLAPGTVPEVQLLGTPQSPPAGFFHVAVSRTRSSSGSRNRRRQRTSGPGAFLPRRARRGEFERDMTGSCGPRPRGRERGRSVARKGCVFGRQTQAVGHRGKELSIKGIFYHLTAGSAPPPSRRGVPGVKGLTGLRCSLSVAVCR